MGYPQKSKSVSMVVDLDKFSFDQTASFDDEGALYIVDWDTPSSLPQKSVI